MTDAKYRLYGRAGTGSDIVRMLLEDIAVPYDFIAVGTDPADIEAYRALALTDKVPVTGVVASSFVEPELVPLIEAASLAPWIVIVTFWDAVPSTEETV